MDPSSLRHIAWAKSEMARHRFDLADSAVAPPDLEAMGLPSRASLPREGYASLERLQDLLGERVRAPDGRVLVTAGASEANAIAFGALLAPGDEVLVEIPGYEPHRHVPPLFGLHVRGFPRPLDPGDGSLADAVEAELGPTTRMVVVSHLHNPSGLALPAEDAARLGRLARTRGLWILCDETFRDSDEAGRLGTHAALGERWVATGSLTKSYGLGGLRLGWIAAHGPARQRCAVVQNALSSLPALPSVALAVDLVPHLDALLARAHSLLARNRACWHRFLDRDPPIRVTESRGITAWCRFGVEREGDDFAEHASKRHDLAVAPGQFFGDPVGVRVALGREPSAFEGALAVLERALGTFADGRLGTRHPGVPAPPSRPPFPTPARTGG